MDGVMPVRFPPDQSPAATVIWNSRPLVRPLNQESQVLVVATRIRTGRTLTLALTWLEMGRFMSARPEYVQVLSARIQTGRFIVSASRVEWSSTGEMACCSTRAHGLPAIHCSLTARWQ